MDVLAIVAILFGVATTLGLGVQQINGGLIMSGVFHKILKSKLA